MFSLLKCRLGEKGKERENAKKNNDIVQQQQKHETENERRKIRLRLSTQQICDGKRKCNRPKGLRMWEHERLTRQHMHFYNSLMNCCAEVVDFNFQIDFY